MTETEEALRAEVSRVCRTYYFQVWNEAFNQAGVEASFVLKKIESVYYSPAIRVSSSSSSKADITAEVANLEKSNTEKIPPSSSNPPKVAEQLKVNEKRAEVKKEVALDVTKPPVDNRDSSKEKEGSKMEIVLASLPIPAKGDSK